MKKLMSHKSIALFISIVLLFCTVTSSIAYADDEIIPETPQVAASDGWNAEKTMYYEDGAAVTGLKTIENELYLFDENGIIQNGFAEVDGAKYYFAPENGAAVKGFTEIKGSCYLFDEDNAKMKKGLQKYEDELFYFNPDTGRASKGLIKISGKKYYFDSDYAAISGWKTVKKSRYYFNDNSYAAVKGFKKINNGYYYFNSNCKMITGWKTIKGKKYYFSPKKGKNYGRAVTGKVTIKDKVYRFTKSGKLISDKQLMQNKANNLSSNTKYLVLVNKTTHRVGVFKGKKGDWNLVKYYECTIGASSTPTPSGTFTMGPSGGKPFHQLYFDSAKVRCWYASRISGGYNFHSVLYTQASRPVSVSNPRLGANLSHGCVRLQIDNAKWIYNNIPSGTKCVIYK